jgi:energy-coupling factor transporter transmembrane protein EcfT
MITLIALGVFSLLILLTSINVSPSEIIIGYLRWSSLVIVSVILFLSINALEITTSLVYFHVPLGIAMAVGVGFRFLPVFFEEAKRIRIIQRHREGTMLWSALRTSGLVNALSRTISPLIVSVLRRIDMLLLSIAVQQLEERISNYKFLTLKTRDWMTLLAAIIILIASLVF